MDRVCNIDENPQLFEELFDLNIRVNQNSNICLHCYKHLNLNSKAKQNISFEEGKAQPSTSFENNLIKDDTCKDYFFGLPVADEFIRYVFEERVESEGNTSEEYEFVSEDTAEANSENLIDIKSTLSLHKDGYPLKFPVCSKCSDILLEFIEEQIKIEETDFKDYCIYLKKLETEPLNNDIESLKQELNDLENRKKEIIDHLKFAQIEEAATIKIIKEIKEDNEALIKKQERFTVKYTRNHQKVEYLNNEIDSFKRQLYYVESNTERINKVDVFDVTFHIWHMRNIGTINNSPLGCLPSLPINWLEFNTSWSQITLLLSSLARRTRFDFKDFDIVPFGCYSYIKVKSEDRIVPLFAFGGTHFVWNRKVDEAMVAFLNCMCQLEEHLKQKDPKLILPYSIKDGRILDSRTYISCSIRTRNNSERQWTKALKFMLTNLKWMSAYICNNNRETDDKKTNSNN